MHANDLKITRLNEGTAHMHCIHLISIARAWTVVFLEFLLLLAIILNGKNMDNVKNVESFRGNVLHEVLNLQTAITYLVEKSSRI